MTQVPDQPSLAPQTQSLRIGCVSYLNAKPLIHDLQPAPHQPITFDVPAALLQDLLDRRVDIALCPIVDYFRSPLPLQLVPVGGIACRGPTLTVRLFSRLPLHRIRSVRVDSHSHTSVALLRIILHHGHGVDPQFLPFDALAFPPDRLRDDPADALLLIGDKVVNAGPPQGLFPVELDLGEEWRRTTGLPFVFAIWMARPDADLHDLPLALLRTRLRNRQRIPEIAAHYAPLHHWPAALAEHYLGCLMHYDIGPDELRGIQRFARDAAALQLIPRDLPLDLRPAPAPL